MNKQKHGGPAFPNSRHVGELTVVDGGMTLRDYFAAKAMQGLLADSNVIGSTKNVSTAAYKMADAMLAERNKEQNKC